MSLEFSVRDNDDLSAKSVLSVATIVRASFLNVRGIGVQFYFKDSTAEAASRRIFKTSPSEGMSNHVSAVYGSL